MPMCNEQSNRIAAGQVRDDIQQLRIPLHFPEGLPNLEPRDSIRITESSIALGSSCFRLASMPRRRSPLARSRLRRVLQGFLGRTNPQPPHPSSMLYSPAPVDTASTAPLLDHRSARQVERIEGNLEVMLAQTSTIILYAS
jgi:hypothetical protein